MAPSAMESADAGALAPDVHRPAARCRSRGPPSRRDRQNTTRRGASVARPLATLGWVTAHLETWFARSWPIAIPVAGLAGLGVTINDGMPWILAIGVVAC